MPISLKDEPSIFIYQLDDAKLAYYKFSLVKLELEGKIVSTDLHFSLIPICLFQFK